jgi:hypothetical protein
MTQNLCSEWNKSEPTKIDMILSSMSELEKKTEHAIEADERWRVVVDLQNQMKEQNHKLALELFKMDDRQIKEFESFCVGLDAKEHMEKWLHYQMT